MGTQYAPGGGLHREASLDIGFVEKQSVGYLGLGLVEKLIL